MRWLLAGERSFSAAEILPRLFSSMPLMYHLLTNFEWRDHPSRGRHEVGLSNVNVCWEAAATLNVTRCQNPIRAANGTERVSVLERASTKPTRESERWFRRRGECRPG